MSIGLTLALLLAQVGVVLAAPPAQTGDVTGMVTNVVVDDTTDPDTVLVTIDGSQTVRILATDAQTLGLVTIDGTGVATPNPLPTDPITIPGAQIVPDTTGEGEEVTHPVALALADFFGVDASEIMDVHENGVCEESAGGEGGTTGEPTAGTEATTGEGGCDSHSIGFGLIAQALWMAHDFGEGTSFEWQDILLAKQNHDFSSLLEGDPDAPEITNWGQFKKYVRESQDDPDKGHNLGGVMSEREEKVGAGTEEPGAPEGAALTGDAISTDSPSLLPADDQNQGNGNGQGNHRGGNHKDKRKKH